MAFSRDGRFLASTAEDRTVCIWSLTNLGRVVGVRGALPGLVLRERAGKIVVAAIRDESPYQRHDLRTGDSIAGYVDSGRLCAFTSALDVYRTASVRRPGQELVVRRTRDGQAARDIALPLGQATDERKPLLILFMARRAPDRERDWILWNPFGPFDASGPDAESLFGWHFNRMSQPDAPARFALAGQYPRFRRTGLGRELIEAGDYPPPPPPPLAPPRLGLDIGSRWRARPTGPLGRATTAKRARPGVERPRSARSDRVYLVAAR